MAVDDFWRAWDWKGGEFKFFKYECMCTPILRLTDLYPSLTLIRKFTALRALN